MTRRSLLVLIPLLFAFNTFAAENLDKELAQRIERDKKTYQAGVEVTKGYTPENEIKYWDNFLLAQPDHVLAPTIKKRVGELQAQLPVPPALPSTAATVPPKTQAGGNEIRPYVSFLIGADTVLTSDPVLYKNRDSRFQFGLEAGNHYFAVPVSFSDAQDVTIVGFKPRVQYFLAPVPELPCR